MGNVGNALEIVINARIQNVFHAQLDTQRMRKMENAIHVVMDVLNVLENNAVNVQMDSIQIYKENVLHVQLVVQNAKLLENAFNMKKV